MDSRRGKPTDKETVIDFSGTFQGARCRKEAVGGGLPFGNNSIPNPHGVTKRGRCSVDSVKKHEKEKQSDASELMTASGCMCVVLYSRLLVKG